MDIIKANAKALILLVLIVLAAITQEGLGMDLGLDIEHYVALLVADGLVWGIPNKEVPEDPEK